MKVVEIELTSTILSLDHLHREESLEKEERSLPFESGELDVA